MCIYNVPIQCTYTMYLYNVPTQCTSTIQLTAPFPAKEGKL